MDYIQWSALWQASKGFGVGFGQGLVFSKMALNLQLATQEETFPNLPRMLVKLSLKHCMREDVPRMFRIRKNDTAAPKLYKQVPILYLLRAEGVNDGISIACAILEWTELIWSEGKSEDNALLCAQFNVKLPSDETCSKLLNFVQQNKIEPHVEQKVPAKNTGPISGAKPAAQSNNKPNQPTNTSAPWGTLGALCGGVAAHETIQFTHTRALYAYALLQRLDEVFGSRNLDVTDSNTREELKYSRRNQMKEIGMSLAVLVWLASYHDAETIMRGLRRAYPSLGV